MPILKSKNVLNNTVKHSLLAGAFLVLVILGSKLDLDFGGLVSFTLQTLVLGIGYYYLPARLRVALILTYLALGIAGVPVFNGGIGWDYFISYPLGFFVGFLVSAFIPVVEPRDFASSVRFFAQMHGAIIICGIVWIGIYASSSIQAFETFSQILPGAFIKTFAGAGIVWLVNHYSASKRIE
jgi:biotin transport system substrate-specific component